MIAIRHKASDCIGCAACVEIAPTYWQLDQGGMARLIEKSGQHGPFDLGHGFEDDRDSLLDAEANCPVDIIFVE